MRHLKVLLSSTGLVLTCLISGCQTLAPKGDLATAQAQPTSPHASKPSLPPSLQRIVKTIELEESVQNLEDAEARRSVESLDSEIGQAQDGVWKRMREGFRLAPSDHPRISRELGEYRKQANYIELIQERARPYIHFILNELEERDMPMEIALLPAIESTFQPFAYSSGRAMGLWQFIPSTGRSYGLKQDYWYDGRRDVVASTHAALDYLTRLNEMFGGDWELTLAAYNSGAGTVQRAMRKNEKNAKPTDYWSLQLPRETRRYVPRLLALCRIFAHPDRYGVSLRKIPDEPYFQMVDVDTQLDLKLAARLAGLSLDELRLLNPGFKRLVTPPNGPHQLLIPQAKTQGFLSQLAGLPQERRMQWIQYKIQEGDNLSVIAQHYEVTVGALKAANNLQSNTILAGQQLVIPKVNDRAMARTRLSQTSKSQNRQQRRPQNAPRHYIIREGDSLWNIALAHNVDHQRLAKWNDLTLDTTLRPGQRLIILADGSTTGPLSSVNLEAAPTPSQVSYEVQEGDSLYRIAERFSVTIPELKKWNALSGEFLQPGQRLKLYVKSESQSL
jgi:membrane-bound lytic murein transglycosylase D